MKTAKPSSAPSSQKGLEMSGPATGKARLPLTIPIEPYMRDHRYNGKIIIPAVEILQRLAASLQSQFPGAPVGNMRAAAFDRFLEADSECLSIEACHELEPAADGALKSRLTTVGSVGAGDIRRTRVHAAVEFAEAGEPVGKIPVDVAAALEGIAFEVRAEKVYAELVPFGPAYQNIVGNVYLTRDGAAALVRGAQIPAPYTPLGSPFPLDAAMHAACAWGQRYRGYVAFPVGFSERTILEPTRPGKNYYCRVLPGSSAGKNSFLLDILIYNGEGVLCENIRDIIMKDVSGGKITPPAWVREGAAQDPLHNIRGNCLDMAVIDTRAVADFAPVALSPAELERYAGMGEKRRKTYVAGRLALKILTRKLSGDYEIAAPDIHTIMPDGFRPCCPAPAGISCSLSHDSQYAFAAADRGPIGVDVERVSERVMKARHLYMTREEQDLAQRFPQGSLLASLRIWCIKEGLSKALGIQLAESWKPAKVCEIGESRSLLEFNGSEYVAYHDLIHDHLFTMVKKLV